jgi:hypothetical protein
VLLKTTYLCCDLLRIDLDESAAVVSDVWREVIWTVLEDGLAIIRKSLIHQAF